MFTVTLARFWFAIKRYAARTRTVPRRLYDRVGRTPRWVLAVLMLAIGSVLGSVGPFVLAERQRLVAQQTANRELLDSVARRCAAVERVTRRYAEVFDTQARYEVQMQLRQFSLRDELQAKLISPSEFDRELQALEREAEHNSAALASISKRRDEALDEFEEWAVIAGQRLKREFQHRLGASMKNSTPQATL